MVIRKKGEERERGKGSSYGSEASNDSTRGIASAEIFDEVDRLRGAVSSYEPVIDVCPPGLDLTEKQNEMVDSLLPARLRQREAETLERCRKQVGLYEKYARALDEMPQYSSLQEQRRAKAVFGRWGIVEQVIHDITRANLRYVVPLFMQAARSVGGPQNPQKVVSALHEIETRTNLFFTPLEMVLYLEGMMRRIVLDWAKSPDGTRNLREYIERWKNDYADPGVLQAAIHQAHWMERQRLAAGLFFPGDASKTSF